MTKKQRAKIVKVIRHLDEIILNESKQTYGLPVLKKCRNQLQQLVVKHTRRKSVLDSIIFFSAVIKLVEALHSFINKTIDR